MRASRTVSSGDVRLAVYEWGSAGPERPTVVLVHGYPDNAGVWQAVAQALASTHHVVAYDVRGAGASTRPRRLAAYRLQHLVNDLAAVLDAVNPEGRSHLVGHDWGAIQGWEAVTDSAPSSRLASFTCLSGPCLDHVGHWAAARLRSGPGEARRTATRQLARSWYIGAFHLPLVAPLLWRTVGARLWPRLLQRSEGIAEPAVNPTQGEDGLHGVNLYRANVLPRLLRPRERRTTLPVQLVVPHRDRYMLRAIWDDLPQWVPRLSRVEVDAGHWLPLSHPQWIADQVTDFVAFVDGGDTTDAQRRA